MANATLNAVLLVSPPQLTLSGSGGSLCDLSVSYVAGYASSPTDSTTFVALTIPTATTASAANGNAALPSTISLNALYAYALSAIQQATGLVFTVNGGGATLFDSFPILA